MTDKEDRSSSRNDQEIVKDVRRWLDDPKDRYSVETRDLRRVCWLAEQFLTRSETQHVGTVAHGPRREEILAKSAALRSDWREVLRQIRANLDAGGWSASSRQFMQEHGGALLDKVEEALESTHSHALRIDVEKLLDNAACAAQVLSLMRTDDGKETVLREAVRLNVVEPLLRLTNSAKQHAVGFEKWMSYQLYYEQNTGSFKTDSQRYYTADQMRAAWEAGATGNLEEVARYFETRYAHVNDSKWIAKEIRDLMRSPERTLKGGERG